nr:PREDICTED: uncharacterized protein LOC108192537 [Daucus carota subsp. sativus]
MKVIVALWESKATTFLDLLPKEGNEPVFVVITGLMAKKYSDKMSKELLRQMRVKNTINEAEFNSDENLFFDLFIKANYGNDAPDCEVLDMEKNWINGEPEVLLGREVPIRGMEK